MIKYIVCEDNKDVTKEVSFIINKVMMSSEYDYKVIKFDDYNDKLLNLIKEENDQKVYILDIGLPSMTGLDIAELIRKYDYNSIIIILTINNYCKGDALSSRLMVLDYISKQNNYKKILEETLSTALTVLDQKKILKFEYYNTLYRYSYDEILYIKSNFGTVSTIVLENGEEVQINKTLLYLKKELGSSFEYSQKGCLVNVDKIKKLDLYNKEITFINNKKTDRVSYKLGRELKQYVRNY